MKIKVCLVGDKSAGKTELVRRFVHPMFDDRYIVTLGTHVSRKDLVVPDPNGGQIPIDMTVWDIMGNLASRELLKQAYFYGASAILAVCNARQRGTLEDATAWVDSILSTVGNVPVVFAANDSDLGGDEAITEGELHGVAQEYAAPYFFTSTRAGQNVEAAFRAVAEQVVARRLGRS